MSYLDRKQCDLSDELIAYGIAKILLSGAVIAVVIVFVGTVIYLWWHGLEIFNGGRLANHQMTLTNLTDVLSGAASWDGRAIIELGLLVLIATPIARVAFSVVAFVVQKDRIYVISTSIVLAVLCYSLLSG